MCGIFGFFTGPLSTYDPKLFGKQIQHLLLLSESRGKDASGILFLNNAEISVIKRPLRAKKLLRTRDYIYTLKEFVSQPRKVGETLGIMGHARMVTNGSEETHENNQPVISHDMCMLHNGIIVNDSQIWSDFPDIQRQFEVDTEVAMNLIWHYKNQQLPIGEAFRKTFSSLDGANTFALISAEQDSLILATSNGSLYFVLSPDNQELLFSSELYILKQAISNPIIRKFFSNSLIVHVAPNQGYIFGLQNLHPIMIGLENDLRLNELPSFQRDNPRLINDKRSGVITFPKSYELLTPLEIEKNDLYLKDINDRVSHLKRCIKCALPETFPYIEYDNSGVCNYCRNHKPLEFLGKEAIEEAVKKYRKTDGSPDCLVPISGGRDSCYGLYYIKEVLKMNPVAFTYDWGMVTDLARRNISRMCGSLGVEHILISADIKTKRKYIKQNVNAWFKHPTLGTIPLFMAGDKQFFYYAQMLKKQMDIDLIIFSFNRLEQTDFKLSFVTDVDEKNKQLGRSKGRKSDKYKILLSYVKEYIINPAYLNSSFIDTIFAFFSYFMVPKNFITLYNYIRWDENEVNDLLINKYKWETEVNNPSTWRIGDGTASFYNYIYYTLTGFSENDTFRSNQIREGMITRKEALKLIERDNQPRYDSFQWYCNTIGIDAMQAIESINHMPKLF